jgi:MinD superfamily P-loop ATPase
LAAARSYADDLLAGEVSWRKNSLSQRLNCRFARDRAAWKLVRAIFDVGVLPERCSRCGLCQRLCPVRNIVQPGDQPPQFAGRCIACQRCFAFCPTGAIYSRRPGHVKPYRAVSADDILQAP